MSTSFIEEIKRQIKSTYLEQSLRDALFFLLLNNIIIQSTTYIVEEPFFERY